MLKEFGNTGLRHRCGSCLATHAKGLSSAHDQDLSTIQRTLNYGDHIKGLRECQPMFQEVIHLHAG
jgi:hypothetical protein